MISVISDKDKPILEPGDIIAFKHQGEYVYRFVVQYRDENSRVVFFGAGLGDGEGKLDFYSTESMLKYYLDSFEEVYIIKQAELTPTLKIKVK